MLPLGVFGRGLLYNKLKLNEKLYDIVYKRYVKTKVKFSCDNPMGTRRVVHIKNCDKKRKK